MIKKIEEVSRLQCVKQTGRHVKKRKTAELSGVKDNFFKYFKRWESNETKIHHFSVFTEKWLWNKIKNGSNHFIF